MNFKQFDDFYIIRLEKGEEIVSTLKTFCQNNNINLGSVSGIGAVDKVTIGLFEPKTKEYHSNEFNGDFEITSLIGNITTKNGECYLHLHINLSDESFKTIGGHLTSAVVSVTCEIIVTSINGIVEREFSDDIGINFLVL